MDHVLLVTLVMEREMAAGESTAETVLAIQAHPARTMAEEDSVVDSVRQDLPEMVPEMDADQLVVIAVLATLEFSVAILAGASDVVLAQVV